MPFEFVSLSAEPRLKASYFDASPWSRLARDPKCEDIVAELRRRQVIVLASAISAGEILKTPDIGLRKRLCSLNATTRLLHEPNERVPLMLLNA
jgi:hypothetical protein